MRTFLIHEANLERLQKKLDRIRNKCVKYGCDFHFEIVGEEFKPIEDDPKSMQRYLVVEAEGTAVINGWKFVATIDHTEAGNIIRNCVDIEIPEKYRTASPECEHCHSKRHRKDTYIVYNEETGEFKQVGSSCVNDFTNGLSAEMTAQYISLFDEMIKGETPYEGCSVEKYYDTKDVFLKSIEWVKHLGYTPTSSWDTSTKMYVLNSIWYEEGKLCPKDREWIQGLYDKYNMEFDTPENQETLVNMMDYIKNLDDNSDYIHNLKVIADLEYINGRKIGYAVSLIACYNRYIEKEDARKLKAQEHANEIAKSHHIGQVGERINVRIKDINCITSWDTLYGCTHMYKLTDETGNIFIWCTDKYLEVGPKPELVSVVGTVKKHDEFNHVCQTWITRCKVTA